MFKNIVYVYVYPGYLEVKKEMQVIRIILHNNEALISSIYKY